MKKVIRYLLAFAAMILVAKLFVPTVMREMFPRKYHNPSIKLESTLKPTMPATKSADKDYLIFNKVVK